VGWLLVDPSRALDATMALLIVTCPCALGLATPLAVSAAVGRAARRGILIKGGDVLERLAHPGLMLLDKTGTLTEGRTRLVRWQGPKQVKPLVRALEAHSAHHLARALVSALDDSAPPLAAGDVRETPGGGISGTVQGRRVAVGSRAFLAAAGAGPAPWADAFERELAGALTPVFVAVDGEALAAAAFGDPLRPDATQTVDRLRRLGWELGILSGDHPAVVDAVGRTLEVPAQRRQAAASPEAKLAAVERAVARSSLQRPVVMVGDGVNDAAALAAASVGVAVHGGAEASLAAADVFIDHPGLEPLLGLVSGARAAVRVIRRNLALSLAYNLLGATLAVAGIISPLVAAVLMPLSSLTVVTISYRSRTFQQQEAAPCR
jgi:Cu2+-exporting ATPase